MKRTGLLFLISFSIWVLGCQSKEQVYRGVYEGLNTREQVIRPAPEANPQPITQPKPGYDAYKREREQSLKNSNPDNPR
jgi:hypothetical protein